jgi:hypothetical protein
LDFGSDVTSDAAGNAIAIGSIIDTAIVADQSFAAGGWSDVFLVKIGPIGGVVWAKAFGNEHAQLGHSIAADGAGNILLMTWSSSGIDFGGGLVSEHTQLAKLGPSGEHQWSMGYPNAMPPWESHSLAVGGAGQLAFAVIGDGLTSVDLGGGAKSGTLLVAQLDATGQHQWSRAFGGRPPHGTPIYASVAIDPDDNVIVTGSLYDTIDFGGGPLTSAGGSDVFVAKFDSLGQHLYSRRFGDASTQDSTDIAVADIDGNIVVGGLFVQGELDFGGGPLVADGWSAFLVELDPMGDHVWSKSFPVDGFPAGRGVAAGTAGDVLMAGGFSGIMDLGGGPVTSSDGDFDIYVARFDTMGNHLHSAQFGSARRWQLAYGAAAGSTGGVLLTGYFDDEIDFGTGLLETRGNDDAFMAQLCR